MSNDNSSDPRLASNSLRLPLNEGYADQPYVIVLPDNSWVCLVTSATGHEGDSSQGVVSLRSTDHGQTWSSPVRLEPAGSPENSYAVGLVTPQGRIFAFYNFNSANLRDVQREDGGSIARVDSLGDYVFRYSDDGGRSWSASRHVVPVREFACDRNNVYRGAVRFFWNVGRPCIRANGEVIIPLHKVGAMGEGFFAESEGAFLLSPNILTEPHPDQIIFETLPDGDVGLKAPAGGGRIAEEQSVVELSDASLYCVYRSVDGWPACSYSRDGGHTWEPPQYKTYTPGGKRMKNPRAANFAWKLSGNRYLYWFHNHGGHFIRKLGGHASLPNGLSAIGGRSPYDDRNPVWICGGREVNGPDGKLLKWSQPEIFLYEDDPMVRMSYPDLIEDAGRIWITETNKSEARLHEVPSDILDQMFSALDSEPGDLTAAAHSEQQPTPGEWRLKLLPFPKLLGRDTRSMKWGTKDHRAAATLRFVLGGTPADGEVLFDTRNDEDAGILVRGARMGRIELILSDGRTTNVALSDPEMLSADTTNSICVILDGGPKLVLFVINGILCDGGDERQFGWTRYSPHLREINGNADAKIAARVQRVDFYSRALRVNEAAVISVRTEH